MANQSPRHDNGSKPDESLLDLDNEEEGGASRNSLLSGEVDIQEWERRLASGDLPDDFLKVTEPTASVTAFSEKPKQKTTDEDETATLLSRHVGQQVPASQSGGANRLPSETEAVPDDTAEKRPKTTEETDHELAMALQKQLDMEAAEGGVPVPGMGGAPFVMTAPANVLGRLTCTVAEAKLARNYGIARMDPYCRIRIGHCVYETPTCPNGAREPKWNKTFNCFLLQGVTHIDVEIYDECTFSADSMVAHATFTIPDEVVNRGIVVDEWWPLSGQEGHDKEGMIHLILSLQPLRPDGSVGPHPQQPQQKVVQPALPTEEQLQDFSKMFPNIDKEIIKSVFAEKRGNLEETANCLLQLSQE